MITAERDNGRRKDFIISWSISTKVMWPNRGSDSWPLDYTLEICHATYCATTPGMSIFVHCWLYMSHDMTKQTKWLCAQRRLRSAWASVQSDQSSSLSTWRNLGSLATHLSAQRRLWSDWADAQADLSLRWTHSHTVGLSCRGFI